MKYVSALTMVLVVTVYSAATAAASTLDTVISRGTLQCGVSGSLPGFSFVDANGTWTGIDVDMCRAISAAVFGDADKVKYQALSARERFDELRDGKIDVLSRNTTWTLIRDATGMDFAGVIYYDGQSFMVHKELGIKDISGLSGAAICVTRGTTTEINLAEYFETKKMTYTKIERGTYNEIIDAYEKGVCDAFTADQSALFAHRTRLKDPAAHIVLPEIISKEPLGPVVRQIGSAAGCDNRWVEIVRWTLFTMLAAEELGVNSNNVDKIRKNTKNPRMKRLLGLAGETGKQLGLPADWGYQIIKQVGNYAEIFDHNLGPDTPLKVERGLNALWKDGGIHYPLPIL